LQRTTASRQNSAGRCKIAVAISAPDRILIGARAFPGYLIAARRLLDANRRPATKLARHNISAVIERPGVGYNLSEHPLLSLTYRTRIPTYNPTGGWRQKASFAAKFALFGEGPISNLFEATAFLRSSRSELTPDIQLHFLAFGFLRNANGVLELAPYPSFTILLNKSHPSSRGRIRLASADPTAAPLIECQLLQDQDDVDTLVRGITMVRAILAAEPIASLIDSELSPGPTVVNAPEIEAYVRRSTSIAFHPSGTCRMGVDAAAVVDPELRVHGTDNLWVADASVMPDLISGNTNAVCMMIGMKLGRFLNEHHEKSKRRLP